MPFIILNNKSIKYTLKKSRRACNMRLSLSYEDGVVVTLPYLMREKMAENFLIEKADWVIAKLNEFKNSNNIILPKVKKNDYPKYKLQAYEFAETKLEQYNRIYNFQYNRICIRDQKTRWGSCSIQGNLNFNFKIIFLHPKLADYIVVHELCHLKEMNHSKSFWDLVAETVPDHKELRRKLKRVRM